MREHLWSLHEQHQTKYVCSRISHARQTEAAALVVWEAVHVVTAGDKERDKYFEQDVKD